MDSPKQQAIRDALRRYGAKMLADEEARGILPHERELLDRLDADRRLK